MRWITCSDVVCALQCKDVTVVPRRWFTCGNQAFTKCKKQWTELKTKKLAKRTCVLCGLIRSKQEGTGTLQVISGYRTMWEMSMDLPQPSGPTRMNGSMCSIQGRIMAAARCTLTVSMILPVSRSRLQQQAKQRGVQPNTHEAHH